DPASRRDFWDALTTLAGEGMTIVVATPYLDEAERCHRVALIDRGKLQGVDTPDNIRKGGTLEEAFVSQLEEIRGRGTLPAFPQPRPADKGDDILLDASHLKKKFGSFQAVKDFSLRIRRGEVYG